jgi:hypothetical protein
LGSWALGLRYLASGLGWGLVLGFGG